MKKLEKELDEERVSYISSVKPCIHVLSVVCSYCGLDGGSQAQHC